MVAGQSYNVQGLVDALGYAYAGTFNDINSTAVAFPSLSVSKNNQIAIIVGAPDEFTQAAISQNIIYGAYHNVISEIGTSAVWAGAISPFTANTESNTPSVVVKGLTARSLHPNNLAFSPSTFVFYEKNAKKSTITVDEAVKRYEHKKYYCMINILLSY